MPRIAVIGQVGVGKSTLCKNLAKLLPSHSLSLEPIPNSLKGMLKAKGTDNEWRQRLYHTSNIIKANYRILKARQQENVIMERPCAENFFIFCDRLNGSLIHNAYKELADKTPVDFLVVLTASPEVVSNRINKRGRPGEGVYSINFAEEQLYLYLEYYRSIAKWHKCKIIKKFDCSLKTPDELANEVYEELKLSGVN